MPAQLFFMHSSVSFRVTSGHGLGWQHVESVKKKYHTFVCVCCTWNFRLAPPAIFFSSSLTYFSTVCKQFAQLMSYGNSSLCMYYPQVAMLRQLTPVLRAIMMRFSGDGSTYTLG